MQRPYFTATASVILTQAAILVAAIRARRDTLFLSLGLGGPRAGGELGQSLLASLQQYSRSWGVSYWWMYMPRLAIVPSF